MSLVHQPPSMHPPTSDMEPHQTFDSYTPNIGGIEMGPTQVGDKSSEIIRLELSNRFDEKSNIAP